MADKPTSIRTAQTLAIFATSAATGASLSLSFFVVPRLLESPTPLMLRQWHNTYEVAKLAIPAIAEGGALAYLYLTYRSGLASLQGKLYLLSGALCVGIIPWTLGFMRGINRKLLKKVEETRGLAAAAEVEEKGGREESAKWLVDQWGVWNLGRGVMLAVAGAVGTWVSL